MTAEDRIDDLERRLERYHEWLVDSIQQRDRLALDAAWGVHYAFYSALGTIAAIYAVHRYVGDSGWVAGFLFVSALTIIPLVIHIWSNGARMKEVDRLAKLPEWEWRG